MKHLFALLISAFCFQGLAAQISAGPKVGGSLNFFSLKSTDFKDRYQSKPTMGFLAGVAVEVPLVAGLSLQPELYLSRKGGKLKATDLNRFLPVDELLLYYNQKFSLNYLDAPLLVKYEFMGGSMGYYLQAGPSFSFGMGGKVDGSLTDQTGSDEAENPLQRGGDGGGATRNYESWYNSYQANDGKTDLDYAVNFGKGGADRFKTLDMGIAMGGGMYFELGYGRIYLDLRYIRGLKTIYNEEFLLFKPTGQGGLGQYFDDYIQKNNALQLSVNYMIPLSGGGY